MCEVDIDLLIYGGVLVNHDGIHPADILVSGERILDVLPPGSFTGHAKNIYNAEGKHILPGLIDPHVHMAHPYKGEPSLESAHKTSVSAAFGGTTTLLDFAIQWDQNLSLQEVVDWRRSNLDDQLIVDYGLHVVPTRSEVITLTQSPALVESGTPSFKVYMVYRKQGRMVDDAVLYGLLKIFADLGGTLMVHAENNAIAEFNQAIVMERGKPKPVDFPKVKPNLVEAEAVNRVLYLNHITGSRLYIVHLSTREGLELAQNAIQCGDNVIIETCPHYLCLTDNVYEKSDGGRFICSPPLRSSNDVDALWEGLASGLISTIGSDHCGFGKDQKDRGDGDFSETPHGLPGVELRLPLIYTEGVLKGRISLPRMVELLSTNPAKVFGLYPRKGTLKPGADADLIIVNFDKEFEIRADDLHGGVDWTPYDGWKVKGLVEATILRGNFLIQDRNLVTSKSIGKYLHRDSVSNREKLE